MDINFAKSKQSIDHHSHMSKKSVFPEPTDTEKLAFLRNLNKLFPDAAVLTECYETHSTNPASNFTS